MSSQASFTPEIESIPTQGSTSALASTLPSAFNRMMGSSQSTASLAIQDPCHRPPPIYNDNYNPYELLSNNLDPNYSPYA